MKVMKAIGIVLGIAVVLCGSTARANVVNGGFETGDLSGWTSSGTVQAVQWEFPRDPLGPQPVPAGGFWEEVEGDWFASLWSTAPTLESTLEQSFTAPLLPGYRLEFDYYFDFGDFFAADTATGTLTGPGGPVTLFEHNTPGNELLDDENVDWTHVVSDPLVMGGAYTLSLRITDFDGFFESVIGVDNLNIVPVPGAFLLGAIGLGVANWRLRRRRMS